MDIEIASVPWTFIHKLNPLKLLVDSQMWQENDFKRGRLIPYTISVVGEVDGSTCTLEIDASKMFKLCFKQSFVASPRENHTNDFGMWVKPSEISYIVFADRQCCLLIEVDVMRPIVSGVLQENDQARDGHTDVVVAVGWTVKNFTMSSDVSWFCWDV